VPDERARPVIPARPTSSSERTAPKRTMRTNRGVGQGKTESVTNRRLRKRRGTRGCGDAANSTRPRRVDDRLRTERATSVRVCGPRCWRGGPCHVLVRACSPIHIQRPQKKVRLEPVPVFARWVSQPRKNRARRSPTSVLSSHSRRGRRRDTYVLSIPKSNGGDAATFLRALPKLAALREASDASRYPEMVFCGCGRRDGVVRLRVRARL